MSKVEFPEAVGEAMKAVQDYNWEAEIRDWVDNDCLEEGHVFLAMVIIDQWLYRHEKTPRQMAQEAGLLPKFDPDDCGRGELEG